MICHLYKQPNTDLSMSDFGKNLSILRKQRRLRQFDLAGLLDAQPRMVGRWEQGIVKPQFDYVVKLAQVFEVSIDYLVFGEKKYKKPAFVIKNRRLKELCKQADALQPGNQETICRFMEVVIKQEHIIS